MDVHSCYIRLTQIKKKKTENKLNPIYRIQKRKFDLN